ncbi:hypothetical protein [Halomarina litorea]|uniref:hypothetical protein n=1 Tax=Halomarina litorea TaxID=2961595 RepID=UPI0020C2C46A|nr:hypothetical protein [Halomarina sp. BCD28]
MRGDGQRTTTRRRLLAGLAAGTTLGLSGCVTLSPSFERSFPDSQVFVRVSASEPWAVNRVRATVTLTERATTELGVRTLVVVTASGSTYTTATVSGGQTSVTTYVPLGTRVKLVAVDNAGAFVEQVTVQTP